MRLCGEANSDRPLKRFLQNCDGVAGIEFALIVGILCILMLNGIELARYIFIRMQVENAAQLGVQAAWKSCDTAMLPATTKCSALTNAISAAIQATSLGAGVQLLAGSPSEGYYCINASNNLEAVGSLTARPIDCASVGKPNEQPGDYIKVEVSYAFTPLSLDFSVVQLFQSPIRSSAHMRLL